MTTEEGLAENLRGTASSEKKKTAVRNGDPHSVSFCAIFLSDFEAVITKPY